MQAMERMGSKGRMGDGLAASVAAALGEIAAMQAERSAPPVRSARLRLAVVYGQARLARQREREGA